MFEEAQHEDNSQLEMPGGVDINSHEDMFNAVFGKVLFVQAIVSPYINLFPRCIITQVSLFLPRSNTHNAVYDSLPLTGGKHSTCASLPAHSAKPSTC